MLTHPEIVHMYLKKIRILFQGKEMPAKKKLGQTKLRAVLANFGFPPIFQKINNFLIDIHFFFLLSARSHLFREYLRENDFLRETILTCLSGAQMGWMDTVSWV